jgi:hypothetical protein
VTLRVHIPDDATDWMALAARVSELERAAGRGTVAAKGVRVSSFDVASAIPATTVMPFDASPAPPAAEQHYQTHPDMLDHANGTITLPEDGVYSATGFWTVAAAMISGATIVDMIIQVTLTDGTIRAGEERRATNAVAGIVTVSGEFLARAGDVVRLLVGHNVGSTTSSGTGSESLPWYLAIHKVRNLP